MINIEKLSASRGYRKLFKNISFSVASGEIYEVRGKNGSGKSTLLRILAGLTQSEAGKVVYDTSNSGDFADWDPASFIHYLGHQDSVKAQETVLSQMKFWADFYAEDNSKVALILENVGLWKRRDVPGRGLSAGQKRRLSLARLMLSKRPIWLLDEPLAALDHQGQDLVKDMVSDHVLSGGCVVAAMHGPGFENAQTFELSTAKPTPAAELI